MDNYIFAASKSWSQQAFDRYRYRLPGRWVIVTNPDDLTEELIEALQPKYIFFPHWSWKVSAKIHEKASCICFHMTDLPYGRGGSPLQNLIVRGHEETKISALKMVEEMDAGHIYLKESLSLTGSGLEIFERASDVILGMILKICTELFVVTPQEGKIVSFKRRNEEQSELTSDLSLLQVFDHIRMLDIPGYPHAFIKNNKLVYEFTQAVSHDNKIYAHVVISQEENDDNR
ncbi:MAG: hypothetical protein V7765_04400 [Oleispira sp.]